MEVTTEVSEILKSYVYVYFDPRTEKPFYIGKGKGNRLFTHLNDPSDTEKVNRIKEIRLEGLEPRIEVVRYGLTDAESRLVEASLIDLIGTSQLTNRKSGFHKRSFGRIDSREIIMILTAKPVEVKHKALLFTINSLYRSGMSNLELYETTRGAWKLGKNREKAEYALCVTHGIVREVYRIHKWHPAGTLQYTTRPDSDTFSQLNRWEFEGEIAYDIRDQYVGFSVGKGSQNPVRYRNISGNEGGKRNKNMKQGKKLNQGTCEITQKAILITINMLYREGMSELDLYEATRGIWRVGTAREEAEYAFSLHKGVVLEVYKIDQWLPAGTLEYLTRPDSGEFKNTVRWEFKGRVAYEIRDQYIGKFVGKGGQNPIRYCNI